MSDLIGLQLRDTSDQRRGPDEPPAEDEFEAFQEIPRALKRIGIVFLAFFPWTLSASLISPSLGFPAALLWLMAFFISAGLYMASRCPRCGESCFVKGLRRDAFATRCIHCQARLYWPKVPRGGR